MTLAPKLVYPSSRTETLSAVRQYVSHYPDAAYLELGDLARRLRRRVEEVQAAQEWLIQDGLEVRT